ncbi:hypothetical protein [Caballeronia choica]|nr:hypothetical protein [Caballeronia choica]
MLDSEPPYFKGDGILSALVSISASYRITHSWSARDVESRGHAL